MIVGGLGAAPLYFPPTSWRLQLCGERAMINELSRGDCTGPGVDHDTRRYRAVFHAGAGPHSDDRTSTIEVLLCTNRIDGGLSSADPFTHWCSIIARWINMSVSRVSYYRHIMYINDKSTETIILPNSGQCHAHIYHVWYICMYIL